MPARWGKEIRIGDAGWKEVVDRSKKVAGKKEPSHKSGQER